jgi:MarR family transcriptional regulator for hemolysin
VGSSTRAYCVLSTAMSGDFTQIRIAELCGLDKTTMVSTIDELERAGLAVRRPSSTDRRARIIAVTPAGRRLVAKSQEIASRTYDDVLAAIPVRQRQHFVDGLVNLVNGVLAEPSQCQHAPRRPRN